MQEITPLGVACVGGALLTSSRTIRKVVAARRTQNGSPSAFESYRSRVHPMLRVFRTSSSAANRYSGCSRLYYEAFLGTGVGGNHLRIITSPIERIQFHGIATCILPSTKSAGGSETKTWVQRHPSVSITVSCTVPKSLPSGRMTGRPRISETWQSAMTRADVEQAST